MFKIFKAGMNIIFMAYIIFAAGFSFLIFSAQKNADYISKIGKYYFITCQNSLDSLKIEKNTFLSGTKNFKAENLSKGDGIVLKYDINSDSTTETVCGEIIDVFENGDLSVTVSDTQNITVSADNILMKLNGKKIPLAGYVMSKIQNPDGYLYFIVIPLGFLFLIELFLFVISAADYGTTPVNEDLQEN